MHSFNIRQIEFNINTCNYDIVIGLCENQNIIHQLFIVADITISNSNSMSLHT